MKQNLTLLEMRAILGMAGTIPAAISPLAGVLPSADFEPALMESLGAKSVWNGMGMLTVEWQRVVATLADPWMQAAVHIEGIGAAQYFGGAGGIASMAPAENGQQRILGGLTIETILDEINALLPWRQIPDGPPLHADVSVEELTTIAAIADTYREEQLRAIIERRDPATGLVKREDAERHVVTGTSRPDPRWLISILSRFAPQGYAPVPAALDAGAGQLIARRWARPGNGGLEVGTEVETFCAGFGNVTPFLWLAVGAPWSDPAITLLTRGLPHFWSIEFHVESGKPRATISRVGGRAMEELLRRCLWRLGPAVPERPEPPPAKPAALPATAAVLPTRAAALPTEAAAPPAIVDPPKREPLQPAPAPKVPTCQVCGAMLTKPFCTKCGTPARPTAAG